MTSFFLLRGKIANIIIDMEKVLTCEIEGRETHHIWISINFNNFIFLLFEVQYFLITVVI